MPFVFSEIHASLLKGKKLLCVLIDPDKFEDEMARVFLKILPAAVDYLLVGGSSVNPHRTLATVKAIKKCSNLPVILFPGDFTQITGEADGILFLSLLSGRNPEYLIGQQIKSVSQLRGLNLDIIPTGYILIEGGRESAVQRVSQTNPIPQKEIQTIINTALAGQFSGKKMIYLEAGSGAKIPVSPEIIWQVKNAINIPLIVGGGIRNSKQLKLAYEAGADLVVIGTAFENKSFGII